MFNSLAIHADAAQSYARGIASGLLFGTPMLFTMEMWWHGFVLSPEQLLVTLVANFIILLILERYSGFREDTSFMEEAQDAVVAQGLGVVVAVPVLWLINQLRSDMSPGELVGKVIMQSIPISIGISVAMSMLGQGNGSDEKDQEKKKDTAGFWGAQAIALAGAIFFGLNVAVTEEPLRVGLQMDLWQSLVMLILSYSLVFAITYALEFKGGITHQENRRWWIVLLRDSTATWAVAFLCSAGLLLLFNGIDFDTALAPSVQMVLSLTYVTSLGAAAARLLI